ncbi:copper homeostasis protein CutC [Clostridium sp. 'White wine YQ']|uniref:copper homeostasis protein CutC n=1 Tax=Clostridium sp. 'White wine YQ' TaxID=3027474 RepID=UPI003082216B
MEYILEAAVGSFIEAKIAEELGADRIEYCDNMLEGGTTPSIGSITIAKKVLKTPFNVIIRPRGGDFVYTEDEIEIMKMDIQECRHLGINGIVVGVLNKENKIDVEIMKNLIKLAKPMSITFHMAFDEIQDKKEAIDILADLGVDRILTKGGADKAEKNINELAELIKYANKKIIILPGGGITSENFKRIAEATGARELHGTKIVGNLK